MIDEKENENEKKEESIHFSNVLKVEESENKSSENLIEKDNIFTTKYFMKSIDLRCEDHLTKFQEDMEATRFCEKCNVICCDSCVIDYHIDHIASAKKKVEDYLLSQNNLIVNLNDKIKESIKYKINEKEIDKIVDSQKKIRKCFKL